MNRWEHWAALILYLVVAPIAWNKSPILSSVIAVGTTFWFFIFILPSDERRKEQEIRARSDDEKRIKDSLTLNGMQFREKAKDDVDRAMSLIIDKCGWELGYLYAGIRNETSNRRLEYEDVLRFMLGSIEKDLTRNDGASLKKSGLPGPFRLYYAAHAILLELISIGEIRKEEAEERLRSLEVLANKAVIQ